jgi:2-dehydro-3-deoxyphosphogluconate aldolase/(4S)-4-hydroxy-2-oxoglutarate aldolase
VNVTALRDGPVADAIRRHRLVVVLRRVEPREALLALVDELADAGARVFEVTFDAPTAEADLVALRLRMRDRLGDDGLVGAGTLRRPDQLDAALRAGAQFGVAPTLDPALVRTAAAAGLPFVPGALTPSEIETAWGAGAAFVKVFPASAVGPAFVRELRGPMPEIGLIPTGGIDRTNALAYLEAGAAAVGIGSGLLRATPEERRAMVAAIAASTGAGGSR